MIRREAQQSWTEGVSREAPRTFRTILFRHQRTPRSFFFSRPFFRSTFSLPTLRLFSLHSTHSSFVSASLNNLVDSVFFQYQFFSFLSISNPCFFLNACVYFLVSYVVVYVKPWILEKATPLLLGRFLLFNTKRGQCARSNKLEPSHQGEVV